MPEQKIEQDLKSALLAKDSRRTTVLRGLKAAILNAKIAAGKKDSGLSDDEITAVLSKQAKQRQESADMYIQGGDQTRADAELAEKAIIEEYLPDQLSEEEVVKMVEKVIKEIGATGLQDMGKVIGQVKSEAGASADGSVIARITKEKLS